MESAFIILEQKYWDRATVWLQNTPSQAALTKARWMVLPEAGFKPEEKPAMCGGIIGGISQNRIARIKQWHGFPQSM